MAEHKRQAVNLDGQYNDGKMISKKVSIVLKQLHSSKERKAEKSKIVEKLNESYIDFEQKLKMLKSSANCKRDKSQLQNVNDLVEKMEGVDNELKTEKAYITDLDMKVRHLDSKRSVLLKQKTNARNDPSKFQPNRAQIEKSIEILKQKLHAASVQFNAESSKNVELREKIRSLMSERKCFNKSYNNLVEKLQKGKKMLEDLYVSIKNVDLARQNIVNKIATIKSKEEKLNKLQKEEAQELEMRLTSEKEWQDYYQTKIKNRDKECDLFKSVRRLTLLKYQFMLGTNLEALLNIFSFHGFGASSLNYSVIKNDVIKFIKRDDIDIGQLFNYITQLRAELEALQEKVLNLVNETEEMLKNYDDHQYIQEINKDDLERRKQHQIEAEFSMADDLMRYTRDMNRLYKGIENLIQISKTDVSPLLDMLGDKGNVTDFNYLLFLQALESRIIFLMDVAYLPKTSINVVFDLLNPSRKVEIKRTEHTRKSTLIETKITITQACSLCHPPIRSRKSSVD